MSGCFLTEQERRLLLSWRHSGVSVHTSVTVPPSDRDGLERLARYLLRPPVSLERLRVDDYAHQTVYAARVRAGQGPHLAAGPRNAHDFLARVVMHPPGAPPPSVPTSAQTRSR